MPKVKVSYLFLITLIFYFLGDTCFKFGNYAIPYYFVTGICYFLFIIIAYPKTFIKRMLSLYKSKIGKYLFYFICWVFVSIIASLFNKTFILSSFISNFIGNFFCSFLFPLLFTYISLGIVPISKIKKYLFVLLYIITIIGFIEYIGRTYNIEAVRDFIAFVVNRQSLQADTVHRFASANGIVRIASLSREAGELAGFLVVSSPLYYYFFKTKKQILKNNIADRFLKNSIIFLFVFNLILTQSPINLVFMGIILFFYFIKNIKNFYIRYKKIFIYILLILCTFFTALLMLESFNNIDVGNTYLSRIVKVSQNLTSINKLMDAEPSLGTRICGQEAMLYMGIDNPIFGVGYANIDSKWPIYVLNLKHHITLEVYGYAKKGKHAGSGSYMFKILAETGFIGLVLLYLFWISLFLQSLKIAKFSQDTKWIKAVSYTSIIYLIYSFYLYLAPIFMVYFGLALYSIAEHKQKIKLISLNNGNSENESINNSSQL